VIHDKKNYWDNRYIHFHKGTKIYWKDD